MADPGVTGAEHLVAGLRDAGVAVAFGLPGIHNLPLWEALRDDPIRLVGVRHEQAAVYAADGFARASGRTGVALVTTGPGAANTLGALGEAWASRSPVVVVASDVPSTRARRPGAAAHVAARGGGPGRHGPPVTKAVLEARDAGELRDLAAAGLRAGARAARPPGLAAGAGRPPPRRRPPGPGAARAVRGARAVEPGRGRDGRPRRGGPGLGRRAPAAGLGRGRGSRGRRRRRRRRPRAPPRRAGADDDLGAGAGRRRPARGRAPAARGGGGRALGCRRRGGRRRQRPRRHEHPGLAPAPAAPPCARRRGPRRGPRHLPGRPRAGGDRGRRLRPAAR